MIAILRHAGFTNLASGRRVWNSLFTQTTYQTIALLLTGEDLAVLERQTTYSTTSAGLQYE